MDGDYSCVHMVEKQGCKTHVKIHNLRHKIPDIYIFQFYQVCRLKWTKSKEICQCLFWNHATLQIKPHSLLFYDFSWKLFIHHSEFWGVWAKKQKTGQQPPRESFLTQQQLLQALLLNTCCLHTFNMKVATSRSSATGTAVRLGWIIIAVLIESPMGQWAWAKQSNVELLAVKKSKPCVES